MIPCFSLSWLGTSVPVLIHIQRSYTRVGFSACGLLDGIVRFVRPFLHSTAIRKTKTRYVFTVLNEEPFPVDEVTFATSILLPQHNTPPSSNDLNSTHPSDLSTLTSLQRPNHHHTTWLDSLNCRLLLRSQQTEPLPSSKSQVHEAGLHLVRFHQHRKTAICPRPKAVVVQGQPQVEAQEHHCSVGQGTISVKSRQLSPNR